MTPMYYIFSANGWLGKNGMWASKLDDAKEYDEATAEAYCKRRNADPHGLQCVPVVSYLANAVMPS